MPVIVRVTAESSLATESVNVWHFRLPDVSRVAEADEVVDKLDTFYTALNTIMTAATWTIGRRVTTVDLNPNQVVGATSETSTSSASGTTSVAMAAVLHFSGANIGPRYRGRVYLGPMAPSVLNSDGRTIASSARSTITTAATTLMGVGALGTQLVVWSRKFNTATTVTTIGVTDVAGVQRRRLS